MESVARSAIRGCMLFSGGARLPLSAMPHTAILHVTNGDAAGDGIRQAALAEQAGDAVLPWRDVLHDGPVPDGMTVAAAPTGVFSIVGRVQVNGEADLVAVHTLQDQFTAPRRLGWPRFRPPCGSAAQPCRPP